VPAALVAPLLVAVALGLPAPPGAARDARPADAAAPPVRTIFLRDCATCHGGNARGTQYGPDLHGAGAALIDYMVSSGRMPLSSPNEQDRRKTVLYTPEEVRALVAYTARLAGGGPPIPAVDAAAGELAQGSALFQENCAACHAWSGDGGALLEREAPSVHLATETQIAEAVRTGPTTMPAFGEAAFTQHQLDSLVRYVRYLAQPEDRGGQPLWHLGPMAEGAVAIIVGLGLLVVAIRWIGTRT
jgi:ubiquinol-cytochrome c reductase cytochrome c subunit